MKKYVLIIMILLCFFLSACGLSGTSVTDKSTPTEPESTPIASETDLISSEDTALMDEQADDKDFEYEEQEEQDEQKEQEDLNNAPESFFSVLFIDVGQGDAALVICDDKAMLIDGGDAESSSLIYSILRDNNINYLDYIIASHPETDHVGGLSGALNFAAVGRAFCSTSQYEGEGFNNFTKYLGLQGVPVEVPEVGSSLQLGSASVEFVGLADDLHDINNSSLIVKISYGNVSFLFVGDAEEEAERALIEDCADMSCNVLKVGHHGSSTSTTQEFLDYTGAEYAVISCGAYNSYGHPSDATLERLKSREINLLRTDLYGDILFVSDGTSLSISTEKSSDVDPYSTYFDLYGGDSQISRMTESVLPEVSESSEINLADDNVPEPEVSSSPEASSQNVLDYVLNCNSMIFHYPDCKSVSRMKEKNKIFYTGTREDVIAQGYSPCGNCHP